MYNLIKIMISAGRTTGLAHRVDILYTAGKLTDEQYAELQGMLPVEDTNATA